MVNSLSTFPICWTEVHIYGLITKHTKSLQLLQKSA
jgi:hypothetical protein